MTHAFDPAKAEAFAGSLMSVLNHGALTLMISIGHRTGLFDAMTGRPPSTSAEIAAAAGLNERYVREWLGALTTGRIVEVDEASRLYSLPAEHAVYLTRAGGADNMARVAQYVPMLGGVEEDILAAFREGGGVPYDQYPRFQEIVGEGSAQTVVASLESHVLPLVPVLGTRLSSGINVLDLGCGSGRILNRLAALFPASRFTGLDLSAGSIATAQAEARAAGLTNCEFAVRDLSDFGETAPVQAFELIVTFDAVHDHPSPLGLLRGIHRALTGDGIYLMQEIKASSYVRNNLDHPLGPLLYAISTMHCLPVSLAQGGDGAGAMWGEERLRERLTDAGFSSVTKHEMPQDVQNSWYVIRK